MNELPSDAIRYSSKVATIDELGQFKLVHLADGSILKTKVHSRCVSLLLKKCIIGSMVPV